jgi:hypothetical protein
MGGLLKTGWKRKSKDGEGGLKIHEVVQKRTETVVVKKPIATAQVAVSEDESDEK